MYCLGQISQARGCIGRRVIKMKYGLGSDVWEVGSKAQALHNPTISSRTTNGILKDREVKMRNREEAEHLTILSQTGAIS